VAALSKEQRQFNLVLTLVAHPQGLTRDDLLSIVPGYAETFDRFARTDQQAVLKQFERDKSDIRALGIVVDTVDEFEAFDDNQNTRYRISAADYEFPADIRFSGREMHLLRAAAASWQSGSLSLESRHALTKLRALGEVADESLIGVAPLFDRLDETFETVRQAQANAQSISFMYLKPGQSEPSTRTAIPLAYQNRFGEWHTYCFDIELEQFRTFLLSRFTSRPRFDTLAPTAPVPQADYLSQLDTELTEMSSRQIALLSVHANSEVAWMMANLGFAANDDGNIVLHYTDIALLADQLTEYAHDFEVVSPDALRSAIAERRERIARAHGVVS